MNNTQIKNPDLIMEIKGYQIRRPTLSTLKRIAQVMLEMKGIDEHLMKIDPVRATNNAVKNNLRLSVKVVALAILGARWTRIFVNTYTLYLMEKLQPADLPDLSKAVLLLSDMSAFVKSARLASAINGTKSMVNPEILSKN